MFGLPLNELTAFLALPILTLVLIGFWPHFITRIKERHWNIPDTWLILAIMVWDVRSITRLFFWDIYRNWYLGFESFELGQRVNASFNTLSILGGILALTALYTAIPKDDRKGWNIFTAPFYPKRLRNLFQRG